MEYDSNDFNGNPTFRLVKAPKQRVVIFNVTEVK
jgi:hypothetical protein